MISFGGEFGLYFLDGGKAALKLAGQGFGDLGLPGRDSDGLVEAAQRILDDKTVFSFAKQEADGGLVIGVAQKVVHGGAVEVDLADITGHKVAGLEFHNDITAEPEVIEEKIDREVVIPDFEANLPPDEGESGSHFEKELLDVVHEGLFDFRFAAEIGGAEKIKEVGVFESLRGEIGVGRGQCCREVVLRLSMAEMQLLADLHLHDAAAPSVGDRLADVEVAGGGVFDHLEEADDVAPWQLRNRLFRNCIFGEGQCQKLHGQEIAGRKAFHSWKCLPQVMGQPVNDPGAPALLLLALEDDFSRLPVSRDNDRIGREDSPNSGVLEVALNFLQRGDVSLRQVS